MEPDRSGVTVGSFRRMLQRMGNRRFLDVVADILTLAALAAAGLGHLVPWVEIKVDAGAPGLPGAGVPVASNPALPAPATGLYQPPPLPGEMQIWHAVRSGIALGAAALLVGVSLTVHLGVRTRKILVLLVFAAVLAAILFQILIFSPYPITEAHRGLAAYAVQKHEGFLFALIPSLIAAGLCLVRMVWTMTASPHKNERHLR